MDAIFQDLKVITDDIMGPIHLKEVIGLKFTYFVFHRIPLRIFYFDLVLWLIFKGHFASTRYSSTRYISKIRNPTFSKRVGVGGAQARSETEAEIPEEGSKTTIGWHFHGFMASSSYSHLFVSGPS